MRRLCKHLCAVRVRATAPPFYVSTCSFNTNPPIDPTCRVPKFIVYASLLQTPCLGSVKLSFCLNPIAKFKVAARPFCSESVPLCPAVDCSVKDAEKKDKRLESDADKLYDAVIDNSNPYDNMEKALEQVGLELTTELVVEVLYRLRFKEKIAFRFFTWAGHRENYDHELLAYNAMIDMLSSTRYKVKRFGIVCDLLDYMKRREKSTVPVEVLLKILRQHTEKHLTHLHKFAQKKKIKVKTQPEINAFYLLLNALCKCSLVQDAETMFEMVKNKVKLNADTFNTLFFGWCSLRNPTRGMRILEEMIELGHTPDNFVYNTAIDTFCRAGMVTEAAELFEFMRTKGSTISSPTAKTYSVMIVALVQNDRMEECFKLLGHMINSGCLPDVSTYKDLIEGMCLAGKIEEAYKFLEEMWNKGYPPDIVTYNYFLKVLCHNKKIAEVRSLYGRMLEMGYLPSVQTYNMLISIFFEMVGPDGAIEAWNEMVESGCAPDAGTYCLMIDGLFCCNKVEDACLLLKYVVNKGMKLPDQMFDSIFMQLSIIGDLRAIKMLSKHMGAFYKPPMARLNALMSKKKKKMTYCTEPEAKELEQEVIGFKISRLSFLHSFFVY